jgi:hypothetical protein
MIKKVLVILVVLSLCVIGFFVYQKKTSTVTGQAPSKQNAPSYRVNLLSGTKYASGSTEKLRLEIKNQNDGAVKDFTNVQDYPLHLLLIRSDRTGFQHIHPMLNKETGEFTQDILFPLDGSYRLYAEFTEIGKAKTNLESKITVGDLESYEPPEALNINKSAAVSNGFIASFYFPPNDDSVGPANTDFFAGANSTLLISIETNSQPFKNLEPYHGSLGTLTVFGPDMQPIVVSAQKPENDIQSGLLTFELTFPKTGHYKLFLETKANQKMTLFNFAANVKEPSSPSLNSN